MDSDNVLNLSEQEIEQLNERHIGGVDKWLRMFMGIASEITGVANNVIYLQVVYSKKIELSKAETVARTWLKSPKNAFLRQAETIIVTEYADRGLSGDAMAYDDQEINRPQAVQRLDMKQEEPEMSGKMKLFLERHSYDIENLLKKP